MLLKNWEPFIIDKWNLEKKGHLSSFYMVIVLNHKINGRIYFLFQNYRSLSGTLSWLNYIVTRYHSFPKNNTRQS